MSYQDLLQEASDPATTPERLRELAEDRDEGVQRAAWRNPSLPEEVWRTALLDSIPEPWANPMASLYVLAWTPRQDDPITLENAVRWAAYALWKESERCSPEGKSLLNAKVQEGWASSEDPAGMMQFLRWWAQSKGNRSNAHKEVVHILVLCMMTAPHLTTNDRQALDLLETWSRGGNDECTKANSLASSTAIKDACWFAVDSSHGLWNAVHQVVDAVVYHKQGAERQEARADQEHLMADLIRREMPLPPVVE